MRCASIGKPFKELSARGAKPIFRPRRGKLGRAGLLLAKPNPQPPPAVDQTRRGIEA